MNAPMVKAAQHLDCAVGIVLAGDRSVVPLSRAFQEQPNPYGESMQLSETTVLSVSTVSQLGNGAPM